MNSEGLGRMAVAVLALGLTACGGTASRAVTQSSTLYNLDAKDSKGHALAFDSRGRGAYIVPSADGKLRVCAEPPPDATANLKADLATKVGIDASVTYQAIAAQLKTNTENNQALSSTLADVVQRTELTLVLRDSLYRLCELNINGVMNNEQTLQAYNRVMDVVSRLAQRDNVGKLIGLLSAKDSRLQPNQIGPVLALIQTLSVTERACAADDDKCKGDLSKAIQQLLAR